jgi:hypothetical protein
VLVLVVQVIQIAFFLLNVYTSFNSVLLLSVLSQRKFAKKVQVLALLCNNLRTIEYIFVTVTLRDCYSVLTFTDGTRVFSLNVTRPPKFHDTLGPNRLL